MFISAQTVADKLKAAGLTVSEVLEPNQEVDGAVCLPDNIAVQVGFDYLMLNQYEIVDGEIVGVTLLQDNTTVERIIEHLGHLIG